MFNVTGGELVIILLVALIVLGPEKLPDAIRKVGRVYGELRRMSAGFQSELKDALDEPMREMRDTMNTVKGGFTFGDDGETPPTATASEGPRLKPDEGAAAAEPTGAPASETTDAAQATAAEATDDAAPAPAANGSTAAANNGSTNGHGTDPNPPVASTAPADEPVAPVEND
ncbi:MAG TPA: Sec-independent protein translocase protein TatB [Acidimicrobiales bacterium]